MRWLAILCLAACGAASHAEDTLGDSVRVFNDDVWWSKFDNAASFVPTGQRADFLDGWDERAKDLKITQYDIVKVTRKTDAEAHVQIKLEWYKDSEGTVRETSALQTWERKGKHWMMVDEARVRGAEMPGLPEPMEKDPDQKDAKAAKDGKVAAHKQPDPDDSADKEAVVVPMD
jgi:hypothetical protein